jgi:signal peptidase II
MMPDAPAPVAEAPATVPPVEAAAPRAFARPAEWIIMLAVVSIDQISKELVRRLLPLASDPVQVIPGLLDLTHVQNTGAAFGLLNGVEFAYKPAIMIGIAAVALVAIAAYATQLGFHERMARAGLALILGGAFGNLIDRALFGHVVDFVDVYWRTTHFWAFNVADAAITIGAILVLFDMIGIGRRHAPDPV